MKKTAAKTKSAPKTKSKTKSKAKSSAPKSPVRKSHPKKRAVMQKTIGQRMRDTIDNITADVINLFTSQPSDLVTAIMQDHEGLRQYIDVLKDTKRDMTERRRAYELFSSLLKSHTVAEENSVYKPIEKHAKQDLVIRIEEGFVEHRVADDVMVRLEAATDPVIWSAHANVLAELVDHHLTEEEDKMFPLIRKQISKKLEADLIVQYLDLRAKTQKKVTPKNAGVLEVLHP